MQKPTPDSTPSTARDSTRAAEPATASFIEPDFEDDGSFDFDPDSANDYDGGFGPNSYFARAMNKDD